MDRIYAIHFTDHGLCFSKSLPFQGPGDLVSSPDAHLITSTVPCPKPPKLGRRISNPKYESLVEDLHRKEILGCVPSRRCRRPFWRTSENISSLSSQANERYEAKAVSAGLRMDPFVIQDWNEVPEEVASDTMLVVRYSVDKIWGSLWNRYICSVHDGRQNELAVIKQRLSH